MRWIARLILALHAHGLHRTELVPRQHPQFWAKFRAAVLKDVFDAKAANALSAGGARRC